MQQARVIARVQPCPPLCLAVALALLTAGCASTSTSGYGGRFALTQAECNQADSTVTCCLKQNPGQYERCGAVAPPAPQSQPNRLLPGRTEIGLPEAEAAPIPELPIAEEKERWRTDICIPHYEKCRSGRHDGRVWGESQCKACFDACMRHGFWPWQANDKPCPGA